MIIHNATVHSPVERFATALQIEGETIVWLGDEDTAQYRIKAHPASRVIDAQGMLITPSFHNAFLAPAAAAEYHARGLTAGHVNCQGPARQVAGFDLTAVTSFPDSAGDIVLLPSGASTGEMAEFLRAPRRWVPAVSLGTDADAAAFERLDRGVVPTQGLIYLDSRLDVPAEKLEGWQVVLVVHEEIHTSLAALAQGGIPFALGGEGSPWSLIERALHGHNGPISARAAFNALTRGAWRLTPRQDEPRGVLRVGAPADLALWRVNTLAVQAPDTDASMWSTDQRAGTPLLPALGEGEDLPELVSLYHRGTLLR